MNLGIVDYHVDHSQWGFDRNSASAITKIILSSFNVHDKQVDQTSEWINILCS
jgi:hypothetical protein